MTANILGCSMKKWFSTYDTVDKGNGSAHSPCIYAEGVTDTTETDRWYPDTTISLPGSPGSAAPGDCYIYMCASTWGNKTYL